MKRSEIVALVAKTLEDRFDGDNGSWERDAEAVLDAVENAGMLPPFDNNLFMRTWRDGGNGREWEKE